MLCIKNNENPKQLNRLIDTILFSHQFSAEYCNAIQRGFGIRQSYLVPFFGNFIKDLHTIFQSMSSLAVRAYNQATINQFSNSPAQPSANLHFGDRRQLDFVFNYNGEDVYMSKIGVGNLLNVEKMNAAERVLQNISTFHIHAGRRRIDLNEFSKTSIDPDINDLNLNNTNKVISNNIKNLDGKEKNRQDDQQQQKNSTQCTPDQKNQTNSDLHESSSLMNVDGNLTTSAASISAGNLNTLASTPNAGSIPVSPFAMTNSTQTFQQPQISTICNALQQCNIQSSNAQSNQTLSTNTVGLETNQLLDNNNNRLASEQQTNADNLNSKQRLHSSIKETKQKVTNLVENESLYELDPKYSYKPIQPLSYNHGVSFISLSGEQFYSNLNALQLMQHGKINK